MKKITITRKEDKETYEAVMFCVKAKEKDKYLKTSALLVYQGRLITTDSHRIHLTKVNLPNGLYEYSKVKSTITLERINSNQYPNVSNVIPKTYAHKVLVNRKDLLRRCKQAKIMTEDQYHGLTLTFNGRLDLKIVNPDIGNMTAHVDLNQPVKPEIKVGINVRYLIDALIGLKGEEITIGLNDQSVPLVFKNHTQAALIMPMRV